MKLIKIMCLCICLLLLISGGSANVYATVNSYNWYCNREKGNLQPPLPNEFSFINEHSVLWLNTARKDNDSKKVAYLTFDAGYENGNVSKILDVLKEKEAVGAFFILINLIESNPELVLRMQNEGHYVCNHTAYHKNMSKIRDIKAFEKELNSLNDSFKSLVGQDLKKYYRPPEGKFSIENLNYADTLGYKTVFWSFAYADWDNNKQPTAEYAKKKILDNVHNGCVLLLHPTSSVNAEILGDVIDQMRKEGYEFGTLDDLCKELGK